MRHAGAILPLSSAAGSRSWGIGEFPDLAALAVWLESAGFSRLMLLPIGVVAPGDTSPYSAQSAMAIDPMHIALDDVPDFIRAGGVRALSAAARADLDAARAADRVPYEHVRRVKDEALALAFDQFYRDEWEQFTARAAELGSFVVRERWWLDDWAAYSAIARDLAAPDWRDWPAPLRDRHADAIGEARRHLAREVLRYQYVQWVAETQWREARRQALSHGVTLVGDMPFMVSAASPDAWVRPDEFMFDVSLGVPPDTFSETGQDWGLPTYRWDRIAATGYAWMRQRARRMAALFSSYRVDHVIGLFRTYGKPSTGDPFFNPGGEAAQIAQGETILRILIDTGAAIVAEDLGLVPPFLHESLLRLGVPGCRILRWERRWKAPGRPFIDPVEYPPLSAAMTGTHDTETLAGWWSGAGSDERRAALDLPLVAAAGLSGAGMAWNDALRDALLVTLYLSGSNDVFFPAQDLFGWTDRLNVPGTIGDHNWTWRLPWRVDRLAESAEARQRAEFCRRAAELSGRLR